MIAGIQPKDGRPSVSPIADMNSLLRTTPGETKLTGPYSDSFSAANRSASTTSLMCIHGFHCLPLPR